MSEKKYTYTAAAQTWEDKSGVVSAESAAVAVSDLRNQGLFVSEIQREDQQPVPPSGDDMVRLCENLSEYIRLAYPLHTALRQAAADIKDSARVREIEAAAKQLESGESIDQAFRTVSGPSRTILVSILKAGIVGGSIPELLDGYAMDLRAVNDLKSGFRKKMTYPLIVMVAFVLFLYFMGAVMGPVFTEFYSEMDIQMPAATRIMVAFLGSASFHVFLSLVGLACIGLGIAKLSGHLDRVLSATPLIGKLFQAKTKICFLKTFAGLIRMNTPADKAMELSVGFFSENPGMSRNIRVSQDALSNGNAVSDAIMKIRCFSECDKAFLFAYEQINDLEHGAADLADLYKERLFFTLELATALAVPLSILSIGLVVAYGVIVSAAPYMEMVGRMCE